MIFAGSGGVVAVSNDTLLLNELEALRTSAPSLHSRSIVWVRTVACILPLISSICFLAFYLQYCPGLCSEAACRHVRAHTFFTPIM